MPFIASPQGSKRRLHYQGQQRQTATMLRKIIPKLQAIFKRTKPRRKIYNPTVLRQKRHTDVTIPSFSLLSAQADKPDEENL